MFSHINIIEHLTDTVDQLITNIDRKKYYPFFKIAEYYASNKKGALIVSGNTADYFLLNKPIDVDFMTYEFYCDDAVTHARELATLFYNYKSEFDTKEEIDLRLVRVTTRIPNKEISVMIGDREIINLRNLQVHGGVYIIDIVLFVEQKGLFDNNAKLHIISPEHQLIEIYSSLIDPTECSEWPNLINIEYQLRKQLDLINPHTDETKGGKRLQIDYITKKLYDEYASQPGHVVVGNYSLESFSSASRLEVISMYKLEEEEHKIKKILEQESAHVECSINYPHVPTEIRIRRLTGYYIYEKIRKVVIDVFDTATYSLISFNKNEDGVRIGTLFVIAKHLLIDLWTIRYIKKRNQINEEYYNTMVQRINSDLKSLFYEYDNTKKIKWNKIFPLSPDNYLGHYEDEDIAIKRMRVKGYESSTKRYYDYYPYMKEESEQNE